MNEKWLYLSNCQEKVANTLGIIVIKRGGGGGSLMLKPLPISSYQEKVAKPRHANDQRGVGFCKGKLVLLTRDVY